ncbi:MAG: sulfotransferase domain-containing protein [Pseudomonadota bacterium]
MVAFDPDGSHPPVMILGCGRSGTSIFGELFECVGDYTYMSEPSFDAVATTDFARPVAFKVPKESAPYPADPGLSFPLNVLQSKAPNMKYFWIVRHPLDAISSLRVGIANNWGHHPRPPDWRSWLDRPIIEQCAYHWTFLNSVGFGRVQQLAIVMRFEDLIHNPREFASTVCHALGINPDTQASRLKAWARRVQNTNNHDFVEAQTSRAYSRPDHSVRVGRWHENLSSDDVAAVAPIIANAARSFGYDLPRV